MNFNQESMFVAEASCNHKGYIFLKLQKTFIKSTTLKVFFHMSVFFIFQRITSIGKALKSMGSLEIAAISWLSQNDGFVQLKLPKMTIPYRDLLPIQT